MHAFLEKDAPFSEIACTLFYKSTHTVRIHNAYQPVFWSRFGFNEHSLSGIGSKS